MGRKIIKNGTRKKMKKNCKKLNKWQVVYIRKKKMHRRKGEKKYKVHKCKRK